MHALLLLALLADPSGTSATTIGVTAHGVTVTAPDGWVQTKDGTTFIYSSPGKDASLRVDLFEKDKAGDPQDCVDQLVKNLSTAEKSSADSYTPSAIDSQPAVTQTTFDDKREHRQRRIAGCNGKSYFLIDWVELTHAGPKYEKAFTKLLTGIKFAPAK